MIKDSQYIIKRVIIGVIIALVLSFLKSCTVKAATYKLPYGDIQINNSNWYSTYGYYGTSVSTTGTSINFNVMCNQDNYNDFYCVDATAIVLDVCVSTGFDKIYRTANYGSSCPNSCFTQTPYYVDLKTSCKYNNSDFGFLFRVYMPVLKWNFGSGNTPYYLINDNMTFKFNYYNGTMTTTNVYITDEVIGTNYNDNLEIINSQIITAQNQAHTDAQNTQDAINNQSQQQHQDAQNTQNAINDVNDSINDSSSASNQDFNDAISSVTNALPTNSTISSLVIMPITFLQKIIDALGGSCSPVVIGELYEYNMTMPCINISSYIGNIYNIIDVICAGFFAYYFGKKLVVIFHNITSMKEGGLKEAYD